MIAPEQYLRWRGWRLYKSDNRWRNMLSCDIDRFGVSASFELDEALAIQCKRDEDCDMFRRSYIAHQVLRECAERNAALTDED